MMLFVLHCVCYENAFARRSFLNGCHVGRCFITRFAKRYWGKLCHFNGIRQNRGANGCDDKPAGKKEREQYLP